MPGMMLDRDDVDAELVAQQVLVEAFLEQIGGELRVAILVGQARAHRIRRVEHLLRHERIGVFAMIPGLHARLRLSDDAPILGRFGRHGRDAPGVSPAAGGLADDNCRNASADRPAGTPAAPPRPADPPAPARRRDDRSRRTAAHCPRFPAAGPGAQAAARRCRCAGPGLCRGRSRRRRPHRRHHRDRHRARGTAQEIRLAVSRREAAAAAAPVAHPGVRREVGWLSLRRVERVLSPSGSAAGWSIPAPISSAATRIIDTAQEQKLDHICRSSA